MKAGIRLRGEALERRCLRSPIGHSRDRRQVVADRRVVARDAIEGGDREREARGIAHAAVAFQVGLHRRVLRGIGDDCDVLPVLGRRADHRGAADVDVLDRVVERAVRLRDRRFERIKIDDQQVDRPDAVLVDRGDVGRDVAPREQAAVDLRMQRLHAPVEHLGKAGVVGDLDHRQAGVGEQLRGAAGGQQLDLQRRERGREGDHTGLVGNGKQRATDHRWDSRLKARRS